MTKKILATLLALLIALTGATAMAAGTETRVLLVDSTGKGIPNVRIDVSSADASLSRQTDQAGVAIFSSVSGLGSLTINHCEISEESIALEMYDADFGSGNQQITLRLPNRAPKYEFKIASSNGLQYQAREEIGYRASTTWVESYVSDYGTLQTEIGEASLSSCGSAWVTNDTLRVAPFSTSLETPTIRVEQLVPGGSVRSSFPITDLDANSVQTLSIGPASYVDVDLPKYTINLRSKLKVTGKVIGMAALSELGEGNAFYLDCATPDGRSYSASSTPSKADTSFKVQASALFYEVGNYRCVVHNFAEMSSAGFDVKVNSAPPTKAQLKQKYKNCSALNKVFAGGIAKSTKTKLSSRDSKLDSWVSSAAYGLNKKLDKDKDGVVCER